MLAETTMLVANPALPTLGQVRQGLHTAGTRIRWETIGEWQRGMHEIHNRLCRGGGARAHAAAMAAQFNHACGLALAPELLLVASREQVIELRELLGTWRDARLAPAREGILRILEVRDQHLRRLDDEPAGERQNHVVLFVASPWGPLRFLDVQTERERLIRPRSSGIQSSDVLSASAEHAARHTFRRERLAPQRGVLVLAGASHRGSPTFVGSLADDGTINASRERLRCSFTWFQTWRREVQLALLDLQERVLRRGSR